jgi:hypothetical protein
MASKAFGAALGSTSHVLFVSSTLAIHKCLTLILGSLVKSKPVVFGLFFKLLMVYYKLLLIMFTACGCVFFFEAFITNIDVARKKVVDNFFQNLKRLHMKDILIAYSMFSCIKGRTVAKRT